MSQERLFQYAIIKHPTSEGGKAGERSEMITEPTKFFLARSESEVSMIAIKTIPEEHMQDVDRLEVAVRLF